MKSIKLLFSVVLSVFGVISMNAQHESHENHSVESHNTSHHESEVDSTVSNTEAHAHGNPIDSQEEITGYKHT